MIRCLVVLAVVIIGLSACSITSKRETIFIYDCHVIEPSKDSYYKVVNVEIYKDYKELWFYDGARHNVDSYTSAQEKEFNTKRDARVAEAQKGCIAYRKKKGL